MGMIPEEVKQQVLDATDIVELIGSYFPLKRAGANSFKALCPFHNEKSPSFNVNPARQTFHCFGCKEGGDAISFVRKYENLDFAEAVRRLADRVGIVVHEEVVDAAEIAKSRLRGQLLEIHKQTTEWFQQQLFTSRAPDAERARAYLRNRGLGRETAEGWRIGFAPANGEAYQDWARAQGYSGKAMAASGLMALRDEDNPQRGLYTRFRDRVMFPIANDYGEVIAFSGRVLDPEAKTAKYVNSPETPIFDKGRTFFGLDKSKRAILKEEWAIVCEGQVDLITCFEAGIENIVAPLGTAFTPKHASLLRRFTGEVVLCFDSDEAGYKAAVRTFGELAAANIVVKAVELPEGQDPDTLVRDRGVDAFRALLSESRPFYEFQIDHMARSLDMAEPRNRIQFANELSATVARIPDKVHQDHVIQVVATRLGTSGDDFRQRVAGTARAMKRGAFRTSARDDAQDAPTPLSIESKDVAMLCKLALTNPEVRAWMTAEKARAEVVDAIPEAGPLGQIWSADFDPASPSSVNVFLSSLDENVEIFLHELLNTRSPGASVTDAKKALKRLEIRAVAQRMDAVDSQLMDPNLNDEEKLILTTQKVELYKELLDLKKQLNDIAESRAETP